MLGNKNIHSVERGWIIQKAFEYQLVSCGKFNVHHCIACKYRFIILTIDWNLYNFGSKMSLSISGRNNGCNSNMSDAQIFVTSTTAVCKLLIVRALFRQQIMNNSNCS